MITENTIKAVMPAKAGIQNILNPAKAGLDSVSRSACTE
jgi:hypothetical protein